MKVILACLIIAIIACFYHIGTQQEEGKMKLIRSLVNDPKAEVKWSELMNDGEVRNYTVWRNGECSAVIGIRKDKSYYVNKSHCKGD